MGQQASSLEELNGRLADWLQTLYHVRHHEDIGMSPAERFAHGSAQVRPLDPHVDLDRLFYAQESRRVRKDDPRSAPDNTCMKWIWRCAVWKCACGSTRGLWPGWKSIIEVKVLAWPTRWTAILNSQLQEEAYEKVKPNSLLARQWGPLRCPLPGQRRVGWRRRRPKRSTASTKARRCVR